MDYRSITMEDRPWIERCRDPRKNPFTALSFTSLFTWSRDYGLEIGGDDDFFVIRSRKVLDRLAGIIKERESNG